MCFTVRPLKQVAGGRFLGFARNDGEGEVSAVRYWLTAAGLPAKRESEPSEPSGPGPQSGPYGRPLPSCCARYMAPFGDRSNGVRTLAKKRAFPFEVDKGLPLLERKKTQSSPAGGHVPCHAKKDRCSGLFSYQHSRSSSTGQWSLPRISEWMEAPLMWSFHTLETRK